MMDLSQERNVGFLRAAGRLLQEKILLLELRKRFFKGGRDRDTARPRPAPKPDKPTIHNEPPVAPPAEAGPLTLDEEEVIHEQDAPCGCGGCLSPLGEAFEEAVEVSVTEQKYVLHRHRRRKYKCTGCGRLSTAPGPAKLVSGSEYSIDLAAEVASEKFGRHIPLERQRVAMEQNGLIVSVKTLFSLTEYLADILRPVAEGIRGDILGDCVVNIDETPMRIISSKTNGYLWALSNRFGCYYQYEPSRRAEVAAELLKGFEGAFVCDAYSGYKSVAAGVAKHENERLLLMAGCWSHLRRKLVAAEKTLPEASKAVDLVDGLFRLEHEATDYQNLYEIRNTRSRSLVGRLEQLLESMEKRNLRSHNLGTAITYFKNNSPSLKLFLEHPEVPFDNNRVERALRGPVLGRKNYTGFRTINGADVGATFFTIINSAKLMGLDPRRYITETARRIVSGEKFRTPYKEAVLKYGESTRFLALNRHLKDEA